MAWSWMKFNAAKKAAKKSHLDTPSGMEMLWPVPGWDLMLPGGLLLWSCGAQYRLSRKKKGERVWPWPVGSTCRLQRGNIHTPNCRDIHTYNIHTTYRHTYTKLQRGNIHTRQGAWGGAWGHKCLWHFLLNSRKGQGVQPAWSLIQM